MLFITDTFFNGQEKMVRIVATQGSVSAHKDIIVFLYYCGGAQIQPPTMTDEHLNVNQGAKSITMSNWVSNFQAHCGDVHVRIESAPAFVTISGNTLSVDTNSA